MKDLKHLEVWFVTGSQHLYGEETLKKVAAHSSEISASLNDSKDIPVTIVFKPTVKSPEEIYNVCLEANSKENCIGIITWMHTFSPARMWINGLKILQKHPNGGTREAQARSKNWPHLPDVIPPHRQGGRMGSG